MARRKRTLKEAVAEFGPPDKNGHVTRFSDSSLYDEVCVLCGLTDGRVHDRTIYTNPCPVNPPKPHSALLPYLTHHEDCALRGHWMEAAEKGCTCGLAKALEVVEAQHDGS